MQSLEKQCPYCGNNFTQTLQYPKSKKRIYCTRSCGAKATFHKRSKVFNSSNRTIWSNEELEYLRSLIGKKQLPQIKATWNDIAKRKGWDKRSDTAIEVIVTTPQPEGMGLLKFTI